MLIPATAFLAPVIISIPSFPPPKPLNTLSSVNTNSLPTLNVADVAFLALLTPVTSKKMLSDFSPNMYVLFPAVSVITVLSPAAPPKFCKSYISLPAPPLITFAPPWIVNVSTPAPDLIVFLPPEIRNLSLPFPVVILFVLVVWACCSSYSGSGDNQSRRNVSTQRRNTGGYCTYSECPS